MWITTPLLCSSMCNASEATTVYGFQHQFPGPTQETKEEAADLEELSLQSIESFFHPRFAFPSGQQDSMLVADRARCKSRWSFYMCSHLSILHPGKEETLPKLKNTFQPDKNTHGGTKQDQLRGYDWGIVLRAR